MAKEKVKKESKSDREDRWADHLRKEKEYNPSVYDTRGGDKQLDTIPESFK